MNNDRDEMIKNALNTNRKKAVTMESEETMTLDEINSFGDKKSIKQMFNSIGNYNKMLKESITFCNDALTAAVPFTRENLYLICAYTGSGKSTMAANISYPLMKQKKKILVLSNEESEQDVIMRIACLELGLNFNSFKKGLMKPQDQLKMMKFFPEVAKYVKVLDVNYKNGATTKLETVMQALELVKKADYSCVMLDYYQLVRYSKREPSKDRFSVLSDFWIYLRSYIKQSNIPVVLFAQLHSIGKRPNKDLDSRIKECPGVIEAATVAIEMIPNFENKTGEFIIHKDRFGYAGKKVECGFEHGRYVALTPQELETWKLKYLTDNLPVDDDDIDILIDGEDEKNKEEDDGK